MDGFNTSICPLGWPTFMKTTNKLSYIKLYGVHKYGFQVTFYDYVKMKISNTSVTNVRLCGLWGDPASPP